MSHRSSRRSFALSAAALLAVRRHLSAGAGAWAWGYPIARPDDVPGNGFRIGHGFATQNTWFYPAGWHTGEDWYALDGETAGAHVLAAGDGEIVYAGYDYPGLVVIVAHDDGIYSVYGHLDSNIPASSGTVSRGDRLGVVHDRTDGRAPSHLHFEMRRFLVSPEVNGASPRYTFTCGPNCPPGPGYWPIDAPEHPVAMGWLNPVHAIMRRAIPVGGVERGVEVMVADGAGEVAPLFALPGDPRPVSELVLVPGTRYALNQIESGAEDAEGTSADAYRVWFRIEAAGQHGPLWTRAVVPSADETGADGRPSSVRLLLVPVLDA